MTPTGSLAVEERSRTHVPTITFCFPFQCHLAATSRNSLDSRKMKTRKFRARLFFSRLRHSAIWARRIQSFKLMILCIANGIKILPRSSPLASPKALRELILSSHVPFYKGTICGRICCSHGFANAHPEGMYRDCKTRLDVGKSRRIGGTTQARLLLDRTSWGVPNQTQEPFR